jgi:hypothetical protein
LGSFEISRAVIGESDVAFSPCCKKPYEMHTTTLY